MNKEVLPKKELDILVKELGKKITDKCHEIGGGIVFICVMRGGFMFFSDLVKCI